MISDVGNITDIFPLFSNLFSLERESAFAVASIMSLSAFRELNKITFYRQDELRTEQNSVLDFLGPSERFVVEGGGDWKLCSGYET
jgi:hypothetical protein